MDKAGTHKLRLAVFDLDGTLIELNHEHFAQQIELTMGKLGIFCPPRARILDLIHRQRISSLFSGESEQEAFWSRYDDGECPPPRLFERSLEAVEAVASRGLTVAIATARFNDTDEIRRNLASTGLLRHVTCISTFHGTSWRSKETQLRLVCREHRLDPKAAMMVGDSEDDLRSALNVGFGLRLGKLGTLTPPERLLAHRPWRVLSCIGEVPGEVDRYHGDTAQ